MCKYDQHNSRLLLDLIYIIIIYMCIDICLIYVCLVYTLYFIIYIIYTYIHIYIYIYTIYTILYMMINNCFCNMVDWWKCVSCHIQPGRSSEVLTIANLRHAAGKVQTYTKQDFGLPCYIISGNVNHYTKTQLDCLVLHIIIYP